MRQGDRDRVHGELRRLLLQGDPAAEGGLGTADKDRLRRRIVAAAGERARPWVVALRPLVYAVAVLAVLAAGWLAMQNLPRQRGGPPVPPPADAAPLAAQDRPGEERRTANPEPPVAVEAPPRSARQPVLQPTTSTVSVPPPPGLREPRQLQFITGTTRVIWTLDPDFDLGASKTAEQGETS